MCVPLMLSLLGAQNLTINVLQTSNLDIYASLNSYTSKDPRITSSTNDTKEVALDKAVLDLYKHVLRKDCMRRLLGTTYLSSPLVEVSKLIFRLFLATIVFSLGSVIWLPPVSNYVESTLRPNTKQSALVTALLKFIELSKIGPGQINFERLFHKLNGTLEEYDRKVQEEKRKKEEEEAAAAPANLRIQIDSFLDTDEVGLKENRDQRIALQPGDDITQRTENLDKSLPPLFRNLKTVSALDKERILQLVYTKRENSRIESSLYCNADKDKEEQSMWKFAGNKALRAKALLRQLGEEYDPRSASGATIRYPVTYTNTSQTPSSQLGTTNNESLAIILSPEATASTFKITGITHPLISLKKFRWTKEASRRFREAGSSIRRGVVKVKNNLVVIKTRTLVRAALFSALVLTIVVAPYKGFWLWKPISTTLSLITGKHGRVAALKHRGLRRWF